MLETDISFLDRAKLKAVYVNLLTLGFRNPIENTTESIKLVESTCFLFV